MFSRTCILLLKGKGAFQVSGIMRYAIWQRRFFLKFVVMYALNQSYSLWPVSPFQVQQLIARMLGYRPDISVTGVWGGTFERTYFDVGVFNPHAPANKNMSLQSCYRNHELEKKHFYIPPLVLSATAGMGLEATVFFKHLASMLAQEWESYSSTLCWLHCRLCFILKALQDDETIRDMLT